MHRIGRTGRAGMVGQAMSLVCIDEHAYLRSIERLIRKDLRQEVIEGFEPDPNAIPQDPDPRKQGRGARNNSRRNSPRPQSAGQKQGQGAKSADSSEKPRRRRPSNRTGSAGATERGSQPPSRSANRSSERSGNR